MTSNSLFQFNCWTLTYILPLLNILSIFDVLGVILNLAIITIIFNVQNLVATVSFLKTCICIFWKCILGYRSGS